MLFLIINYLSLIYTFIKFKYIFKNLIQLYITNRSKYLNLTTYDVFFFLFNFKKFHALRLSFILLRKTNKN